MTKRQRMPPRSAWQEAMLGQLKEITTAKAPALKISRPTRIQANGNLYLWITLDTSSITRTPAGLPLGDSEELLIVVYPSPVLPPQAFVLHTRFAGYPHVLQGCNLCIYLDPSREWDPLDGMTGFINRLWAWLEDAATDKFDGADALFHPVGGVLHYSPGAPTVVGRDIDAIPASQAIGLHQRTSNRLDLVDLTRADARSFLFVADHALPFGATSTLRGLVVQLGDQGPGFLTMLGAASTRNAAGTVLAFVLSIPHPSGGPSHLLAGRIPARSADGLREVIRRFGVGVTLTAQAVDPQISIEWCNMSDERPCVTKRRDDSKPVNGLTGKTVFLWGCGGLGSWIGEFVVRAGATQISLCDPGIVTGGLLVRQDFVENDIGTDKATALAGRLQAISDGVVVKVYQGPDSDQSDLLAANLIIDATISIAVTRALDGLIASRPEHPCIAQVSTDVHTGTLGLLHLSSTSGPALDALDVAAGAQVQQMGELESFERFWQEPRVGDELIPTRGCSVPTFHGSAADMAALAAVFVNQIGEHLLAGDEMSGTHLFSLPSGSSKISHLFLPWVPRQGPPTE